MRPHELLTRLRERKLVQWALAYAAAAWVALQVGNLLSGTYHWSPLFMRALPILLLVGFFAVLVLAWYHGEKGQQRASTAEIGMLTALFVIAGASLLWIGGGARRVASAGAVDEGDRADSSQISIAVLPFENLSGDKDNEYFADGVAEDILADLSKIKPFRVTSRTSVAAYKGTTKNVRTIAAELGVRYVLEGSVQREGGRVRIRPQLIDARRDRHVWAESYERELKDVFAIQTDIAEEISRSLRATLTPAERSNIGAGRTENLAAYDLYLKGRTAYQNWGTDSTYSDRAIAFYRQALEIDPSYALAHTGLAEVYADRGEGGEGESWADSARLEIRRALEVAPDLPEAHLVLGWIDYYEDRYEEALADFQRTLEIDPSSADALWGLALVAYSRAEFVQALRWTRRAKAVSPTRPDIDVMFGRIYMALDEPALAEESIRRALPYLEGQARLYPLYLLAETYLTHGQPDRAEALADSLAGTQVGTIIGADIAWRRRDLAAAKPLFEQVYRNWQEDGHQEAPVVPPWQLAFIYAREGKTAGAEKLLELIERDARKRIQGSEDRGYWPYSRLAIVAAIRHERAPAIEWLGKAADRGWLGYRQARTDPVFDELRGDPAFESVLTDVEARARAMRERVEREGP